MTAGWVIAADQSFKRVPISRMQEAYDDGMRVLGGYAGGGSTDKWMPAAECRAWLDLADDTGVVALFEIEINRPISHPGAGDTDARAARVAWRARGYPDHASICPAVDTNVSPSVDRAALVQYFSEWAGADTAKPLPYIEADAGAMLHGLGLTAGTFTPAAWGWNNPAVLYTPANAPDHVVWTQEANGRIRYGADLDMGHIRTAAPIWWADGRTNGAIMTDVDLTPAAIAAVRDAILSAKIADRPAGEQTDTGLSLAWAARGAYFRSGYVANTGVAALAAAIAALAGDNDAVQAALARLETAEATAPARVAAAVVTAIMAEPGAGTGTALDEARVTQIVEQAFEEVLGRTTATLAVDDTAPTP
jgi:hypothetical protein